MTTRVTPCGWEPDLTGCKTGPCCPDVSANPVEQALAEKLAIGMLWRLTGMQFGCCELEVRPCKPETCDPQTLNDVIYWDSRLGSTGGNNLGVLSFTPTLVDGAVYNIGCGCNAGCCTCKADCEFRLPGPICEVIDVIVGGVHLGKNQYTVYADNKIVFRNKGVQRQLPMDLPLAPGFTNIEGNPLSDGQCGVVLDTVGSPYTFEFPPNKQDVQFIVEFPVGGSHSFNVFQPQNFDVIVLAGGNPTVDVTGSLVTVGPPTVPDTRVRLLVRGPKNGTSRTITIRQETGSPMELCEVQWSDFDREDCGTEVGVVVEETTTCPSEADAAVVAYIALGAIEGPVGSFLNDGPPGMELEAADPDAYYCALGVTLEADTAQVAPTFELSVVTGLNQSNANFDFTGDQVAVSFGVPVNGNTLITGPRTGLPITTPGGTVTPVLVSGSVRIDAGGGAPFGRSAGDPVVPAVLRFEYSVPVREPRLVVASDSGGTLSGLTGVPALVTPRHIEWTKTSDTCCPPCQDYNKPLPEEGTWSVVYTMGVPVPDELNYAAGLFACELAKAMIGDKSCNLPERVQAASRQGIDLVVWDPILFVREGLTGIPVVDLIVKTLNPAGLKQAPRVWSPDLPVVRREVQ